MFLGRREHTESSLQSAFIRRENLNTCVVPPRCRRTSIRKPRQDTVPRADYAGNKKAEKKPKKPLLGAVCLLTRGVLIRVRCGVPEQTPERLRCPAYGENDAFASAPGYSYFPVCSQEPSRLDTV